MARPSGVANFRTLEFIQKFDKWAVDYIDPMELLFKIASKHKDIGKGWENRDRLSAAQCLMSYRYPRLKALEISDGVTPNVQISWLDADDVPLTERTENINGVQH